MGRCGFLLRPARRHFFGALVAAEQDSGVRWTGLKRAFAVSPREVLQPKYIRFLQSCFHGSGRSYQSIKTSIYRPYSMVLRCLHASGTLYAKEYTYYEVLGVDENAGREEIKKAFHSLAKKYHPDSNKNNATAKKKFLEIREAYEILHDPVKKSHYDEKLRNSEKPRGNDYGEGFEYRTDTASGFKYGTRGTWGYKYSAQTDFSDSFRKVFSEIFEDEVPRTVSDIQVDLGLSFSEAVKGCVKRLTFKAYLPCGLCDGIGHPFNAKASICATCHGRGKVTVPPFTATCTTCKGSGHIIKDFCTSCQGSGLVEGVKEIEVTVPAGFESGDTVRIPGVGNFGLRGSQPGDLIINIKVSEDAVFVRDGADLYVDANISFTDAILGGEVEVPTISGKIKVKIPKGVQPGKLLVLRGKGLPKHGFFVTHGDQYVRFRIKFPSVINERQRAILEEFTKEEIKNENETYSVAGDWWQRLIEHVSDRKFMFELAALLLVMLLILRN